MIDYERFRPQHGHNIACVGYGRDENIWEYAIECHDCQEILASAAKWDEGEDPEEEGESLLSISDDGEDLIIDIEKQVWMLDCVGLEIHVISWEMMPTLE